MVKPGLIMNILVVVLGVGMIVIVVMLFWMTLGKTPDQRFIRHWKAATVAERTGDVQRAEREFRQALSAADHTKNKLLSPMVLDSLADLAIGRNDLPEAERLLIGTVDGYKAIMDSTPESTIDLKERFVSSSLKLANVLHREKKYSEAEAAVKAGLNVNETLVNVELHQRLQKEYLQLLRDWGRTNDAIDLENKLAERESNDWDTYFYSGSKLFAHGKYDQALRRLEIALAIAKRLDRYGRVATTEVYIAAICFQQEKFDKAYEIAHGAFDVAAATSPDTAARCHIIEACCLRLKSQVNESNKLFKSAFEIDATGAWAMVSDFIDRPHPLAHSVEIDKALAALIKDNQSKIVVLADRSFYLDVLSRRLCKMNDFDSARRCLILKRTVNPSSSLTDMSYFAGMALIYDQEHDFSNTDRSWKNALSVPIDNNTLELAHAKRLRQDNLIQYSMFLIEQNKLKQCEDLLNQEMAIYSRQKNDSGLQTVYWCLALVAEKRKDWLDSAAQFTKSSEYAERIGSGKKAYNLTPEIYRRVALCFERAGKLKEAEDYWLKARSSAQSLWQAKRFDRTEDQTFFNPVFQKIVDSRLELNRQVQNEQEIGAKKLQGLSER